MARQNSVGRGQRCRYHAGRRWHTGTPQGWQAFSTHKHTSTKGRGEQGGAGAGAKGMQPNSNAKMQGAGRKE